MVVLQKSKILISSGPAPGVSVRKVPNWGFFPVRKHSGNDREELGARTWVEMSHKSVMLGREGLSSTPSNVPAKGRVLGIRNSELPLSTSGSCSQK